MDRLGRHIRQITSSRDSRFTDGAYRINTPKDDSCEINIDKDNTKDNVQLCNGIMYTQMFSGLYVTFSAFCAICKAFGTFCIFVLIPILRDNVLPILIGLAKMLRSMFGFIFNQIGNMINDMTKHYRNNTTNWP